MVTLNDIKNYLRIDYNEDDLLLNNLIEQTQAYIDSCVGTSYKKYENKVKLADLLVKKMIADLYEDRELYLDSKKTGYNRISNTILDLLSNCGDENE